MTIPAELEAQILRLFFAERWLPNTIARQLHVHHSTVRRVLAASGVPQAQGAPRASAIDPYVPFLLETLRQYPTLTAARLYVMARQRGYPGAASQFRHRIALIRPRPPAEAFLRLRTLPAEQAQVDWAHLSHLTIGRARRPLMAFVMVLSYSRRIYLRFFHDARLASFLAGHVGAFAAFGGVARVILYDNLKSAVLERQGAAIRFHPRLLEFAGHHRYEPRPVALARGNEKGRVERSIRYIRDAFFAGRRFTDIADLNAQAAEWCAGNAMDRRWPDDDTLRVRDAFATEQHLLLPLPEQPWVPAEAIAVSIGKTPYARFDGNDYSVPHTHVRKRLTLLADEARVRIVDGITVLADHARSYDRGQRIELAVHIEDLVQAKRAARRHRTTDALVRAIPAIEELLVRAAARNYRLTAVVSDLEQLLAQYPTQEVAAAVAEALRKDLAHPNAVRNILDRHRQARGTPPPAMRLPEHLQRRDVRVRIHPLDTYDQLQECANGPADDPDSPA